jgi:hypothetical protein
MVKAVGVRHCSRWKVWKPSVRVMVFFCFVLFFFLLVVHGFTDSHVKSCKRNGRIKVVRDLERRSRVRSMGDVLVIGSCQILSG